MNSFALGLLYCRFFRENENYIKNLKGRVSQWVILRTGLQLRGQEKKYSLYMKHQNTVEQKY